MIDQQTAASPGLQTLTGPAKCDVKVQALDYKTIGASPAEETNASAVLLVPAGTGADCAGPFPLLGYARGTDVLKTRTLANPSDPETFLLAAMYAAQGYVVVASDLLGYAKSAYPYHPYLHANSEASTVIDSLRAARNAASALNVALSGKVMLNGYSQGGHSSMAAQRAIEKELGSEFNVVAGGHMSGPYNLSKSIIDGADTPIAGGQFFVPFFITSWQKAYNGTVYRNVSDVFKAPYAAGIESLMPGPDTFTTLVTSGKLPATDYLNTLFQGAFLQDLKANPNNGVIVAAKKNDLLGWNPVAKTALCGGLQDPTVSFTTHAKPAQADFASRGVNVALIDVDPFIPRDSNGNVDLAAYHGTSVPPLCMAQLRTALFDPLK